MISLPVFDCLLSLIRWPVARSAYACYHLHRCSPTSSSLWERRPAREWSTTPDEGSRRTCHRYSPNSSSLGARRPARGCSRTPDKGSKQRSNSQTVSGKQSNRQQSNSQVISDRSAVRSAGPAKPERKVSRPRLREKARDPGLGRTAGDTNRHVAQQPAARRSRKERSLPWAWGRGTATVQPIADRRERAVDTGIKYNRNYRRNSSSAALR